MTMGKPHEPLLRRVVRPPPVRATRETFLDEEALPMSARQATRLHGAALGALAGARRAPCARRGRRQPPAGAGAADRAWSGPRSAKGTDGEPRSSGRAQAR